MAALSIGSIASKMNCTRFINCHCLGVISRNSTTLPARTPASSPSVATALLFELVAGFKSDAQDGKLREDEKRKKKEVSRGERRGCGWEEA
jgi:hypothetical protein